MTLSSVSDVDDSYRMTVIEKIKGLMDEVDVIHKKEEAQLQKRLVSTETNKKAVGQYKQTKSGVPYRTIVFQNMIENYLKGLDRNCGFPHCGRIRTKLNRIRTKKRGHLNRIPTKTNRIRTKLNRSRTKTDRIQKKLNRILIKTEPDAPCMSTVELNLFCFRLQEAEKWAFKQKQEKEMQDFLKRQKLEEQSFEQRSDNKIFNCFN